ncbi:MAG: hypothetical protein HYZ85_05175 [Candidatus Omnitrophica bacterium]|nr:hypothetical protein [Candidatus Omnitrophota bacterium]
MDIQDLWEKALKKTEIIRPRVLPLSVFGSTHLPYIFLAESSLNRGDTVVRKGEVMVDKPTIVLPNDMPQFEGFESEKVSTFDLDMLTNFLFVRGVKFPSLKYNNKVESLDLREGGLGDAIQFYRRELECRENTSSGLVLGPEDVWQFSILVFTANQMIRQAEGDIRQLWDKYRKKKNDS